ncbi:hypothetical protein V6Z11_A12G168200 [Gossypium hirsutum]
MLITKFITSSFLLSTIFTITSSNFSSLTYQKHTILKVLVTFTKHTKISLNNLGTFKMTKRHPRYNAIFQKDRNSTNLSLGIGLYAKSLYFHT